MPLDSRTFQNDYFPLWAEEPPVPSEGSLVPGSQFHEEQWIMAAGMLARGSSFLYVARAMGCSRTTLWRAYYGSKDFRHRVWWERQALNREADLRLSSLRSLVVEQIERLVSSGDPSTVRWLAERLGLLDGLGVHPAQRPAQQPQTRQPADSVSPQPSEDPSAEVVPELDDDSIPGAFRERTPPNPRAVAAILARPEATGPKGVYPFTFNPDDPYPNLGSALERQGGKGAFGKR
ncbi:hypothetical protein J2848_002397 [Azospirillum lipoferum]|uniref:Homeodomain-like domain-containing protein n=1 Tax=Azospirillum lipoferum TaxID=193 RepID=A0A5A9GQF7_AZOLI|nr:MULTISPECIES: hypothetical protein [Azospirillum]KAA0596711.1 hypothetical protein FZ942_11490 [Azospirillum lipoferum]MCP1610730.1 hypothetical protein [Azospirillum lipoferum]MDW5537824.1 hypothetical protein [Azospirillum sp. NL1]